MKKVLTTLLLLVSLAGISPAADAGARQLQTRVPAASVMGGTLHSLVLQDNGRMRRRWNRRMRWNRGRTDNNWNRGRWHNRGNWNRGRWNRRRHNRNQ
jgi:hypothetical protein